MQITDTNFTWPLTHVDLLSERYGGQALSCNDEFFAEASNLVKRSEPVFIEDKYTDRGKWMDGWETRRRRTAGYDWCILRLGLSGVIRAVDVNTTFFRGNAPEKITLEVCNSKTDPDANADWQILLDQVPVNPHSHNYFELSDPRTWTHLRLKIYPDGGVARLRIYGEPKADWSDLLPGELVDLAASSNGGRALACSDMFFSPMNNLIAPGRGVNMGDGWETKRRREPGHDWVIVKLACAGHIQRVLIDTCHFKGNFPESFMLEGVNTQSEDLTAVELDWQPLIPRTTLLAHTEHVFQKEILDNKSLFTHVRLNIYPDGGVSRMRVWGFPHLESL
jgi:allantoicase